MIPRKTITIKRKENKNGKKERKKGQGPRHKGGPHNIRAIFEE